MDSAASSWTLSHQFADHTSDVKSVHAARLRDKEGSDLEVVFSASRDSTARSWYRATSSSTDGARSWKKGPTVYGGGRYLNSVHFVEGTSGRSDQLLLGGLDSLIRCFNIDASLFTDQGSDSVTLTEPDQIIQEHHNNVTFMRSSYTSPSSASSPLLLSGSWDTTARSFRQDVKGKWKLVHILKGMQAAAWGGGIVDDTEGHERYLTASADLFVRLFEGEELKVIWSGHQDVVRSICLFPPYHSAKEQGQDAQEEFLEEGERLFASTSNESKVLIHSLSPSRRPPSAPTNGGEPVITLKGHTSIVYEACLVPDPASSRLNSQLATVSEDGTLRIWNPWNKDHHLQYTLQHPVETVWCVTALPLSGDLVTGGSDGVVRVWSTKPNGEAQGFGVLNEAGLQEHQRGCEAIVRRRGAGASASDDQDGPIEILLEEQKPGDTTQSNQSSEQSGKQIHPQTGIAYDLLLPIDISDDCEPVMLGVNKGDDPEQVSKAFLEEQGMGQSERYIEEICGFIKMMMR